MLNKSKFVGFAATAKPAEAQRFYREVLGLSLVEDSPFALVSERLDAKGSPCRCLAARWLACFRTSVLRTVSFDPNSSSSRHAFPFGVRDCVVRTRGLPQRRPHQQ